MGRPYPAMREHADLPPRINELTGSIVDAAFTVHEALGPGLLESVYQEILTYELESRGHRVEQEVPVPIVYDGRTFPRRLRLDLLVDSSVILELKACKEIEPVHEAQVLTYLRLADAQVGLLINFNVPRIAKGIHRIVL